MMVNVTESKVQCILDFSECLDCHVGANSVDPGQTAPKSSLIKVYTAYLVSRTFFDIFL